MIDPVSLSINTSMLRSRSHWSKEGTISRISVFLGLEMIPTRLMGMAIPNLYERYSRQRRVLSHPPRERDEGFFYARPTSRCETLVL